MDQWVYTWSSWNRSKEYTSGPTDIYLDLQSKVQVI